VSGDLDLAGSSGCREFFNDQEPGTKTTTLYLLTYLRDHVVTTMTS